MKFVTIRDFRSRSAVVQEELLKEKEMVLTSNGKPVAILSSVNEGDMEEALMAIRRARAALAVNIVQRCSVRGGRADLSIDEINAEIEEVRAKRK